MLFRNDFRWTGQFVEGIMKISGSELYMRENSQNYKIIIYYEFSN
jgi:hypothetical protein